MDDPVEASGEPAGGSPLSSSRKDSARQNLNELFGDSDEEKENELSPIVVPKKRKLRTKKNVKA